MKVLLIDDNAVSLEHMMEVLRKNGYDVIFAKDGQAGIELLDSQPDIVVLDLFMPRMNGWEFLDKKAESKWAGIPTIVASNWARIPEPIPETAGVTDILFKDMDHANLVLNTIRRRFNEKVAIVPCPDRN